jgi:hypothetical protein
VGDRMSRIRIYGDTSGYIDVKAPDVAGNTDVVIPEGGFVGQDEFTSSLAEKAPSASPTFTGTVGLPLTTNYDGTQLSTTLGSKGDISTNAAWTSFDPAYGNVTVGNGVVQSAFMQIGKLVVGRIRFVHKSTTSITGPVTGTLPVTAAHGGVANIGSFYYEDAGLAGYSGQIELTSTTTFRLMRITLQSTPPDTTRVESITGTAPFTWGTDDYWWGYFQYEAA